MDTQFWIYLVVAIIYVVIRAIKKAENQSKSVPENKPKRVEYEQDQPVGKSRPLTFEELLKEITEAKQPPKPVIEKTPPRSEVVDYDEDLGEEEQDLEEVDIDQRKSRSYKEYDEAKRAAFYRPSLEETLKLADTQVQFGKFKVFELEGQRNLLEEYTRDFQDPEGFKKAVVMSEILNRKFD